MSKMSSRSVNNLGNLKHERGCGADMIVFEYCFMHMDPSKASKDVFALYYGPMYFSRWMLTLIFSILFWMAPRTMYSLIVTFDIIWIGITIKAMWSIHYPARNWIIGEEVLLLIWHIIQLVFFADQAKYFNRNKSDFPDGHKHSDGYPSENLQEGAVEFWSVLVIIIFFVCCFIEWSLIYYALTVKASSLQEENLNSEDIKMEMGSNDELNLRMKNYKSIKSGKGPIIKNSQIEMVA